MNATVDGSNESLPLFNIVNIVKEKVSSGGLVDVSAEVVRPRVNFVPEDLGFDPKSLDARVLHVMTEGADPDVWRINSFLTSFKDATKPKSMITPVAFREALDATVELIIDDVLDAEAADDIVDGAELLGVNRDLESGDLGAENITLLTAGEVRHREEIKEALVNVLSAFVRDQLGDGEMSFADAMNYMKTINSFYKIKKAAEKESSETSKAAVVAEGKLAAKNARNEFFANPNTTPEILKAIATMIKEERVDTQGRVVKPEVKTEEDAKEELIDYLAPILPNRGRVMKVVIGFTVPLEAVMLSLIGTGIIGGSSAVATTAPTMMANTTISMMTAPPEETTVKVLEIMTPIIVGAALIMVGFILDTIIHIKNSRAKAAQTRQAELNILLRRNALIKG